MTRDEVLDIVRRHLAEELEVDPGRITESTRLKEDLEADSLDLFTLVQELDDSHGVVIPDDEASRIRTVGEAADAVLRHLPATA
jgi:acyl carrier protein